jgi:hypothetical protein
VESPEPGAGAWLVSVWLGAGVVNVVRFPPTSAALVAAIETMTNMAVLTVRPFGIQVGSRYGARGGSAGVSAASHSEENGRGPADRPERTAKRPGIRLASVVLGREGKPNGWSNLDWLRGS